MRHVRKWIADDGTEFDNKADAKRYEMGGANAERIQKFLNSRDYSGKTERAMLAERTRATKLIASFLNWEDSGVRIDL